MHGNENTVGETELTVVDEDVDVDVTVAVEEADGVIARDRVTAADAVDDGVRDAVIDAVIVTDDHTLSPRSMRGRLDPISSGRDPRVAGSPYPSRPLPPSPQHFT